VKACPQCNEVATDASLVCKGCQSVFSRKGLAPSPAATEPEAIKNDTDESPATLIARAKGELKRGNFPNAEKLHKMALLICSNPAS